MSAYFEHANFSHGDLLDHRILFRLEELLDGDADASFLIATLEDDAVRALAERSMPFVLVHRLNETPCSVVSRPSEL